jgi:hypothetical protein
MTAADLIVGKRIMDVHTEDGYVRLIILDGGIALTPTCAVADCWIEVKDLTEDDESYS